MLSWVSLIYTECPIGIDEKLFPSCRITALRLLLDEPIKKFTFLSISDSINLAKCCGNKQMITYSGAWKTVLILSYSVDTSRRLFLVSRDYFSLRRELMILETPLKSSDLMSSRGVLLVSKVLPGHPLLACMRQPHNKSHVNMFGIRAYIPCYHMVQEKKARDMRDWVYGRRDTGVLDMVLVLAIYSF